MREAHVGRPFGWRYGPCVRRVAPKISRRGAERWTKRHVGSAPRCRVVARDSARCAVRTGSFRQFVIVRRSDSGYAVGF